MDSAGLGDGNDTVSPQWRRGCVCKEMTNSDLTATGRAERLSHIARAWWPVPAIIAATLTAQQLLLTSQHDVGGHAAEHLAGASAPFMAAALLSIMFWATPRAPRQVDLLVVSCVWFATTLLVMLGNLRVVDDLVGLVRGRGCAPPRCRVASPSTRRQPCDDRRGRHHRDHPALDRPRRRSHRPRHRAPREARPTCLVRADHR